MYIVGCHNLWIMSSNLLKLYILLTMDIDMANTAFPLSVLQVGGCKNVAPYQMTFFSATQSCVYFHYLLGMWWVSSIRAMGLQYGEGMEHLEGWCGDGNLCIDAKKSWGGCGFQEWQTWLHIRGLASCVRWCPTSGTRPCTSMTLRVAMTHSLLAGWEEGPAHGGKLHKGLWEIACPSDEMGCLKTVIEPLHKFQAVEDVPLCKMQRSESISSGTVQGRIMFLFKCNYMVTPIFSWISLLAIICRPEIVTV